MDWRHHPIFHDGAGWLLLASLLLSGPVFVARFNVSLRALGPLIVERFHLMPLALVAMLAGIGARSLFERLPRARLAAPALVVTGAIANASLSFPELPSEHAATVEHYVEDTLEIGRAHV
mgnify:CR=1 FL=1